MLSKRILWMVILIISMMAGCSKMYEQDASGQLQLKPEASQAIDAAIATGEAIETVGLAVSAWWPPAALLAGVIGGIAGAAKNLKPKLQTAQNKQELYYKAGESTAAAIEKFKTDFPNEWKHLEEFLKKNHGPEVENVFRGFRGLPPKS